MNSLMRDMLDNFDGYTRVLRTWYAQIDIRPQAKQSTQFSGKTKRAFTPAKKRRYVEAVTKLFRESYKGVKLSGCVRLTVIYSFPFSQLDLETGKDKLAWVFTAHPPDVDNLFKPLADAMSDFCFKNDAQIVDLRVRKIKAASVGIWIRVDEVMPNRKAKDVT